MKTEAFIQDLVSQAQPAPPLYHPAVRFLLWFSLSILFVSLGVFVIGARTDLQIALAAPEFLLQVAILFVLAITTSFSAFFLGVPDLRSRRFVIISAVAIACWLLVFMAPLFAGEDPSVGKGIRCLRNILVLGSAPAVALFYMLMKAYPLQRRAAVSFAFLGAFALSCLGTRFICPNDDFLHFFMWHCLPIATAGGVGYLAAIKKTV